MHIYIYKLNAGATVKSTSQTNESVRELLKGTTKLYQNLSDIRCKVEAHD